MFCGDCGKEIPDNAKVCQYCGAAIEEEESSVNKSQNITNGTYNNIFVEPDEKFIDLLGDGYFKSIFTSNRIKQCAALLSDQRVYLRGNMIDVNNGKISRTNIAKTIDLEDITGTGFVYTSRNLGQLISTIILIASIACFIIWTALWGIDDLNDTFLSLIPGFIALISLLYFYFKGRHTLFFIEYAGGAIKFDISMYGLNESQQFEKKIRKAKNQLKENK